MEGIPLTRVYLESLSSAELTEIADNLGVDILDELDRDSVIQELLETASFDGEKPEDEPETAGPPLTEAVPLPRRYNIAFIDVMIRDPFWAFVFWEIKASDGEQFESNPDFNGYYLKVSQAENAAGGKPEENEAVFTVPVKPSDTAWYLGLAPVVEEGSPEALHYHYKVELCADFKAGETVLAVSKPISLPGQPELSFRESRAGDSAPLQDGKAEGIRENRLVQLSGYKDFRVARRNERPSPAKRSAAAASHE